MKRELAYVMEAQNQATKSLGRTRRSTSLAEKEPELHSNAAVPEDNSDRSGLSVCERSKKFKADSSVNSGGSRSGFEGGDQSEGGKVVVIEAEEETRKSETVEVEVEVRQESVALELESDDQPRRLTRSALKAIAVDEDEDEGMTNGESEAAVLMDDDETVSAVAKKETNMSKKIECTARPTTVEELLATGLLEGYPVFCNGKKGLPLQGTIKDCGIVCSCTLCNGVTVIPPSEFETHACGSYRRAAWYVCLENGKSLLDVLKECRNSSLKTLEETIQSIIGPLPVKESITCRSCKKSFHATSAAKMDQLCDSCTTSIKSVDSRMHSPYERIRFSEMPTIEKLSPKSSVSTSSRNKSHRNTAERDQRMHKLLFEECGLPDGAVVTYYSRGHVIEINFVLAKFCSMSQICNILRFNGQELLTGYKKGLGIFCACCKKEVSLSTFEAHAGWASRKKPYAYVYTSNGVSLQELAIKLLKSRNCKASDNDDLCTICADGGMLVLCDGCPRAFHKECTSLSTIPYGKWYCKYCQSAFQKERYLEHNVNAVAAGRVPGIDPIEQITNRCIRFFKNPEEAEAIACVICRGSDFSKSGFGPRTVILCDQCEKEYHVGCLKIEKIADLKKLPKGKWLCSGECKRIYSALSNLLRSGPEKLADCCLDVMKRKLMLGGSVVDAEIDVSWRLLSGKLKAREAQILLSKAVAVFHDCFDPIVDSITGCDFIPSMVYGENIQGHDFSGMYCAILIVNSEVVSAGIFRIFGQDIAELPLAATRNGDQGKGYFQVLFSCIEKLLVSLNIRSFVLPAAEEAESMWTGKFGFRKIPHDQLVNYKRTCSQMMTFEGTSLMEKMVPKLPDHA
ncbi:hypothetical protein ACH5RR_005528 [Cinchona calisaya]|uniref:PHD-type domain-containing protein n=1 Tax=Cinchona calisaya TaxID=153742 RepID=A0ABD3ALD6_9GENT